jgi:mannose-6-phosphate isomerase-like protein (cupin superfamily)
MSTTDDMAASPLVVHQDEREWEGWDDVAERGNVVWKTLIGAGLTPSTALTLGVARVPSGGQLATHRHEQPEVYLVLDGTGVVTIDGSPSHLTPGASVFIPGGATHSVRADGPADLRFAYVLAADGSQDVDYDFGE